MPADLWVITGLCVWIGSLLFAAFGLFVGYLLPSENVTQVIALALTLRSFAGGLFIPLSHFSPDLQTSPSSRRAGRRHPGMGLEPEPGRAARHFRDRRRRLHRDTARV